MAKIKNAPLIGEYYIFSLMFKNLKRNQTFAKS